MSLKLYVAGPMRGYPNFNFAAFEAATKRLREQGIEVVSPHEHDLAVGFDPTTAVLKPDGDPVDFDMKAAILWDLQQVADCDGVYMLDGWERSRGANLEIDLARFLNKKVFYELVHPSGEYVSPLEPFAQG